MQGMDHTAIESLLQAVARGDIPPEQALRHLGDATAADSLQGLHLDHERALRTGLGEVVFAQGKTDGALVGAVRGLSLRGAPVLVSRASEAQGALLQREFPAGRYWAQCRLFCLGGEGREVPELGPPWPERGEIMVVTDAIRNLIREAKTPQIDSFITMDGRSGSITMDQSLRRLVEDRTVSFDTALSYARDREAFQAAVRPY